MALEGSLKDFGLADILQLIYFQRKTGVLSLDGKMDKVRLLFIEGNVIAAESKRRADDNRLGKVLVKKNLIKEEDLQSALDEQRKTGAKLGGSLIRRGIVAKELVHEILSSQITETVVQIFTWKQGTYEFTAQGVPQDKDLQFTLDTQHLLMEGLRIVDELSAIRDRIRPDMLFRKRQDTSPSLEEEEAELLQYVDGESDVSSIVDLAGRDNFEVSRILLGLLEKEAIEEVIAAPVADETEKAAAAVSSRAFLQYLPYVAMLAGFFLSLVPVLLRAGGMQELKASREVSELRFGIEKYRLEHGSFPENLSALGPAHDPWGNPFVYRRAEDSFYVASSGPDSREKTADDIY